MTKKQLYEDAIEMYKEALAISSKNRYSVYVGIANCCRLKGDYETALNYFDTVMSNQPSLLKETGIKLIICLVELQLYDKAMAQIETVEVANPDLV